MRHQLAQVPASTTHCVQKLQSERKASQELTHRSTSDAMRFESPLLLCLLRLMPAVPLLSCTPTDRHCPRDLYSAMPRLTLCNSASPGRGLADWRGLAGWFPGALSYISFLRCSLSRAWASASWLFAVRIWPPLLLCAFPVLAATH